MRIISKFHDYYDSALSYGIDKTLIYVRKESETDLLSSDVPANIDTLLRTKHRIGLSAETRALGYCGKFFTFIKLTLNERRTDTTTITTITKYAFSVEDIIAFLKKHKLKEHLAEFDKTYKSKELYGWGSPFCKQWAATVLGKTLVSDELFHKYKTPLILFSPSNKRRYSSDVVLTLNPQLKQYDLFRKFDAYTVFQDISMYLGGVLGTNENQIINISDKDMRDAKGFDKWSFKKMPTKKK